MSRARQIAGKMGVQRRVKKISGRETIRGFQNQAFRGGIEEWATSMDIDVINSTERRGRWQKSRVSLGGVVLTAPYCASLYESECSEEGGIHGGGERI